MRRPKRRQPLPVPLGVQALAEMRRAELDATSLGGWQGAQLVAPRNEASPPPAPTPLVIPPPPRA